MFTSAVCTNKNQYITDTIFNSLVTVQVAINSVIILQEGQHLPQSPESADWRYVTLVVVLWHPVLSASVTTLR